MERSVAESLKIGCMGTAFLIIVLGTAQVALPGVLAQECDANGFSCGFIVAVGAIIALFFVIRGFGGAGLEILRRIQNK
jgi:hypothetical protein